ncbi:Eukaryotic initiation factor 3, gamma subunit [Carpediemonas membranifera]|uniref:tRNA (adenine(58)-N(1))-methyltransferase non-catalytic subunit TRM6 n=1 Tax=Carpediemonas membranifera TaxID=201153 RepID=A0A8J6B1Z7_9EUKA|nr:Eukaryotic initiation factor 3, gamma subunit [Carpediemonas membranifera]|eukprot:KAG9396720.1 Eukaryotic initiation factor 3, gamma subunit [Carpediemonas membranifera]
MADAAEIPVEGADVPLEECEEKKAVINHTASDVIRMKDFIFVERQNDHDELIQVKDKGKIRLSRTAAVDLKNLVGLPVNVRFYIDGSRIIPLSKEELYHEADLQAADDADIGDNRDINMTAPDAVQRLSEGDIKSMQSTGLKGTEIIEEIKKNSSTFEAKGTYARAKWERRALAKHRQTFVFRKHTPYSLCAWEFQKGADKICYMQPDSLSQILQMASVRPGARVMVCDQCFGLVQSAAMYRMAVPGQGIGGGLLTTVYVGSRKQTSEFRQALNLSDETLFGTHNGQPVRIRGEFVDGGPVDFTHGVHDVTLQAIVECKAGLQGAPDIAGLLQPRHDCLIIAGNADPIPTATLLLPYVASGAAVVIYHTSLAALQLAADYLTAGKWIIGGEVHQTRLTEHQVLPGRTHPAMSMDVMPGYVYMAYRATNAAPDVCGEAFTKKDAEV